MAYPVARLARASAAAAGAPMVRPVLVLVLVLVLVVCTASDAAVERARKGADARPAARRVPVEPAAAATALRATSMVRHSYSALAVDLIEKCNA